MRRTVCAKCQFPLKPEMTTCPRCGAKDSRPAPAAAAPNDATVVTLLLPNAAAPTVAELERVEKDFPDRVKDFASFHKALETLRPAPK